MKKLKAPFYRGFEIRIKPFLKPSDFIVRQPFCPRGFARAFARRPHSRAAAVMRRIELSKVQARGRKSKKRSSIGQTALFNS
jgi:hypothetical protein